MNAISFGNFKCIDPEVKTMTLKVLHDARKFLSRRKSMYFQGMVRYDFGSEKDLKDIERVIDLLNKVPECK